MAENNKDMKAFELMLKRQMEKETKGMSPTEKKDYMRNFFVKNKTPAKKVMTAAKGGMAKKKMMGGGYAAKKTTMARGGMAKKKK
tara:strand:- start:884 stop:1138 length:255 start_codon:yes stop_codon:yes gene_type:complete